MVAWIDKVKVMGQYFLPKHLISRLVGKLASAELGKTTTFLIKTFIKYYKVDLNEATIHDIKQFKTFNAFFTRALKKNARPIVSEPKALAHPVDGTISEYGEIFNDAVLQAKGHYYSLEALLGGNDKDVKPFISGNFMTIYLSPKDYHRVHMPYAGKLEKMIFIPGDLFSVNPLTAKNVDNLFARNERVVCFFQNEEIGRFAVVMVGATIVASIETVFAGVIAPQSKKEIKIFDYEKENISFAKGDELGRFLLGSTVICVFEKSKIAFSKGLTAGTPVKMGTRFAERKSK